MRDVYLSKMGLPEVRRAVTPPVAPRAKKKNMPPRSLGWRSLALAFSSCMQVSVPVFQITSAGSTGDC